MELYVSVEDLKKHLNVDFDDDDNYLESLSLTAQVSIEAKIQRPLTDEKCMLEDKLNPMLIHAIKIIAGTLYANRESVSFGQPKSVPYTIDWLLSPFIKYR